MSAQQSQRKQRLACDRCHSQKLRCPKTPGRAECSRCHKIGAPCVFGVSLRGTRPAKARVSGFTACSDGSSGGFRCSPGLDKRDEVISGSMAEVVTAAPEKLPSLSSSTSGDLAISSTNDSQSPPGLLPASGSTLGSSLSDAEVLPPFSAFDWPSLFPGFSDSLSAEFLQTYGSNSGIQVDHNFTDFSGTTVVAPLEWQDPQAEDPLAKEPLFKRSDLSIHSTSKYRGDTPKKSSSLCIIVRLSKLAQDLVTHAEAVPPSSMYSDPAEYLKLREDPAFAIDDTFNLSQALLDIYPEFFKGWLPRSELDSSQDCGGDPSHIKPCSPWRPGLQDISSFYMLLACHERLIDIWSAVLGHAKALEALKASDRALEFGLKGNGMGCGKVNALPKSMTRMLLMLMCQFLAQLTQRSSELVERLEGIQAHPISLGTKIELVLAGAHAVQDRSKKLEEEMSSFQQELLKITQD